MKMIKKTIYILIIFNLFSVRAQTHKWRTGFFKNPEVVDTSYQTKYPFVRFERNRFQFFTAKSENYKKFHDKFQQMIETKQGKLRIYHLGGSHLQADIYTHDVRTYLQTHWDSLPGERGWVFPFNLAHSNNPGNYRFTSDNEWTGYRSAKQKAPDIPYKYGLLGYVITTKDSVVNMHFAYRKTEVKPPVKHLKILHNKGEFNYDINLGKDDPYVIKLVHNPQIGSTDVYFIEPVKEFDIQFVKTTNEDSELEIYGFLLTNDQPGISYSSVGVNGAGLYTYLAAENFEEQLALYPPDYFIFSVGTNDGNVPYNRFHPEEYKANLIKMIELILKVNPDCAIVLTVPNDSFFRRRYLNRNIARERKVIVEIAKKYQLPVWDLYGIMGELGSSKIWKKNDLMKPDLIHFTFEGYHFKGKLFTEALMESLQQFDKPE